MHRWFESKTITQAYAQYRPHAPPGVRRHALDFLRARAPLPPADDDRRHGLLLDVGCGSGQTSQIFSSDFRRIIGIDPSVNQIVNAVERNASPNVEYHVGCDDQLPVDDASVDLVVVGQAVHWFDFGKFYRECRRVLKPHGCLAMYGYDRPRLALLGDDSQQRKRDSDRHIGDFLAACHYDARSRHVEDHYVDVYFDLPSREKVYSDRLSMEKVTDLHSYLEHTASFSGYQNYVNNTLLALNKRLCRQRAWDEFRARHDIRDRLRRALRSCWGIPDERSDRDVRFVSSWQMFMITSERPDCL